MDYRVEQDNGEVVVTVEGAEGRETALLEAVRNCPKALHQGCSAECGKAAAFEPCVAGDGLVMHLVPRAGQQLEVGAVRRCLALLWKQPSR